MDNYNIIKKLALERILLTLEDNYEDDLDRYALQEEVFGRDFIEVPKKYASDKEMLEKIGVFDVLRKLKNNEEDFGHTEVDYLSPTAVALRLWYVIGGEVLGRLDYSETEELSFAKKKAKLIKEVKEEISAFERAVVNYVEK